MTGTIPKEYQPLARQVREQGWTVEPTDGDHLRWLGPDGQMVISGKSPSDKRALHDHVAQLRRYGAVIDGRGAAGPPPEQPRPVPAAEPVLAPLVAGKNHGGADTAGPDELREVIAEARGLLGDLQREVRAARALLKGDLREMVTEAMYEVLQDDKIGLGKRMDDRLDEELAGFGEAAAKRIRSYDDKLLNFDRAMDARITKANDLIAALQARVSRSPDGLAPPNPVPAAFRKRAAPRGGENR
jgi:hypothetical protein